MLWLFALSVLIIVGAINVVVLIVFGFVAADSQEPPDPDAVTGVMILCSLATLAVIGLGSLFKTLSLRAGGGVVARSMGGTLVPEDPRDFHLKRLRNVVEEMAIASGAPVPEIYVLDRESGINAFAAGYTPSDAAVAVTRGALDRLSRDELQGVIAHEFSHILNGDMRLNLRLMGWIFGLLLLGLFARLNSKLIYPDRRGALLVAPPAAPPHPGGWVQLPAIGRLCPNLRGLHIPRT